MTENVYIHIPFCKSKCKYCSFLSFTNLELKNTYLQALEKEINCCYKKEPLKTLYFGGGTPSLLDPDDFRKIVKLFNINKNTEITVELNPETITSNYLKKLKKIGINRLSFGCQSFDDEILKNIGRRHLSIDVENSIKYSKDAGFQNVSIDLIYGLPNQTVDMFEKDLWKAVNLDIKHISLYGLKIEPESYFGKNPPNNIPNEDIQADMYLKAIQNLSQNGFEQYEISNFSKKDFYSKHNLNYWNNNTYYGFGLGAHGYENETRYSNAETLDEYITNPTKHKFEKKLSKQEKLEEEIFLGFRKSEGINTNNINKKFDIDFENKYKNVLEKYLELKLLEKSENYYRLTTDGILVSNTILADFIDLK